MADGTTSYRIKDIFFMGSPRRVLMQSANGPCPLLAACNVLLLRNQLKLRSRSSTVSFEELIQTLTNRLLDVNATERDQARAANIESSLGTCIEVLPSLNKGLDVNVRFGGPKEFEYTRANCVFDLLDISLVHGWVVSPEDREAFRVVGSSSYNTLMEHLVQCEEAKDGSQLPAEGRIIRQFLKDSSSQLTFQGLISLHEVLRDMELAVLFRNKHFATLLKRNGALHLLCTDIGFLESDAVWERLDAIDGDTALLNAEFKPLGSRISALPASRPANPAGPVRAQCPSCKALSDFDFAGAQSTVSCGVCRFVFRVQRPPAMVAKTCSKCTALNEVPAPVAGTPAPAMKCGVCGEITA